MSDGRTWGTIIGGVVGFFTGGVGWAVGASIGGVVGGLLEPKKHTETNRIDDIKVSLSKYGDGIPETWGNNIPSATCVWSTYIIELPDPGTSTSGKGGGVENTNYRQFIQSMWCLGRTPELVDGERPTVTIRKAWIDGKLNDDASSGLSASQALATKENPFADIAILPGWDDQLPVALMELYEGVGNVPAFRGRICLFIFGLETPGGRIPQLQFELSIGSEQVFDLMLGDVGKIGATTLQRTGYNYVPTDGTPIKIFIEGRIAEGGIVDQKTLETTPAGVDYVGIRDPIAIPDQAGNFYGIKGHADIPAICFREYPDTTYTDTGNNIVVDDAGEIRRFIGGDNLKAFGQTTSRWTKAGNRLMLSSDFNQPPANVALYDWATTLEVGRAAIDAFDLLITENFSWVLYVDSGVSKLQIRSNSDFSLLSTTALPSAIDFQVPTINFTTQPDDAIAAWTQGITGPGSSSIWTISADPFGVVSFVESYSTLSHGTLIDSYNISVDGSFVSGLILGTSGSDQTSQMFVVNFAAVQPVVVDVASIIASQNLRAGLTADQFDVSTIDSSIWGVTFKSPASARSNISPLMTYAAVGVVEEDGALRYFHRANKTSFDTVPYEELGYAEDGNEPGDPFPLVRSNAQEFPRSITVTYNDYNFDYQQSTVKAMRQAVDTVLDETQVLDVATDGATAASIAQRILYERWLSQNTRSFKISRKFAYWSAGDVHTFLKQDGSSYGAFMISKLSDTGASIEGECFPADGDLALFVVPGPGNYHAQVIEPLAPPTRMLLLDSPIMRDEDNNAGLYVAAEGYGAGWRGYTLWIGDDDSNLENRGGVVTPTPIGASEGALGPWTPNMLDVQNSVIIDMGDDALSSTTEALLMTTRANMALIGRDGRWEAIQFLTASSLGSGRYLISGFLRGLFGTERFRGLHRDNDQFVLVTPAAMLRPSMSNGSIGQVKSYRGVSLGRSMQSASSQRFANQAVGLLPYSPWDARKSKAASNDQTITWQRRSRFATNALRGMVPLGEAVESYSIEFYTSSAFTTLAGTLTSSTRSLTISSAMQTIFGLTPGAALHVHISQISDVVGAGTPLEVNL